MRQGARSRYRRGLRCCNGAPKAVLGSHFSVLNRSDGSLKAGPLRRTASLLYVVVLGLRKSGKSRKVRELFVLSVVSGSCAGRESGLVNFDLQVVILVGMVRRDRIKGDSVEGDCVCQTSCNRIRDVVARGENPPTALRREYLQPEVAILYFADGSYTFEEVLVIERAETAGIGHARRIDTIKRDASLSKSRGEFDHGIEEGRLIFSGERSKSKCGISTARRTIPATRVSGAAPPSPRSLPASKPSASASRWW